MTAVTRSGHAGVVAAALGHARHRFRREVRQAGDRARSAGGAGPAEVALVADQDHEIAVRVDAVEGGPDVAGAVLHAGDRAGKRPFQVCDGAVGERNAGHSGDMVEYDVAQGRADAPEHLREPGDQRLVRSVAKVERRGEEHRGNAAFERPSRAEGGFLDRAGDHALD